MSSSIVNVHSSIQDFMDQSPIGAALRQAMVAGDVIVVPPGEGSNQVQAHADMRGYLKGRTLREAVEATSVVEPAVARPTAHAPRRRPG